MDEKNKEQFSLIKYQVFISVAVIIVAFLGLILTYNLYLKLTGEETFLTEKEIAYIAIFMKILGILFTLTAVYIAFKNAEITKENDGNMNLAYMEIIASLLTFTAAIILIIVVLNNSSTVLEDIMNPEV